ncbi:hypothetical protein [Desulfopila inferna]|uniref:hypothetical protein n=1 Tax=Desulfopila inferna TaxID=468528 RepID=UPI0019642B9E|nr:hypothetical protein [Desulfopila inferna]MBM9606744.1 hypothetical protein [Desulfopila inferna]
MKNILLPKSNILQLIPAESSSALPIPSLSNGTLLLNFLFFTATKAPDGNGFMVYHPNSQLSITFPKKQIALYRDLTTLRLVKNAQWEKPIGKFPHKAIDSLSLKDYQNRKNNLLAQYETILPSFSNSDMEDSEVKQNFRTEFYELCEPCMLPLMKLIWKPFFEWLGE